MSQVVPLDAIPNQELSILLENVRYDIRLVALDDVMAIDLNINDVVVLSGFRVVAGTPVIPYQYLENNQGNFLFLTELDDAPYWTEFGGTQLLVYLTAEEVSEARGN
jgi:hypothetical protein